MTEGEVHSWLVRKLQPNAKGCRVVAWSPDSTRLALGNDDHHLYLVTLEGEVLLRPHERHPREIQCVAFSPDGYYLASGFGHESVRLWDVQSGQEMRRFNVSQVRVSEEWITSVAFSPDSRYLASGSSQGSIWLWDVHSDHQDIVWYGHDRGVRSVAFSPDGGYLASGSYDRSVRLWEVQSGQEMRRFDPHQDGVRSVAFSPDGRYLASGSYDRSVRLWEVQSGQEMRRFDPQSPVYSVAFSPDGLYLASGSAGGNIWLWEVQSGQQIRRFKAHQNEVWSVAFSPDGRYLASAAAPSSPSAEGGEVALWDVSDLISAASQTVSPSSPIGQWLARQAATVGRHALASSLPSLWAPQLEGADGQRCLGVLRQAQVDRNGAAPGSALSSDGQTLVVGHSRDYRLRCWDLRNGQLLWESREAHGHFVQDVAFSPDYCALASGSADHSVRLWDAQSGQLIRQCDGHQNGVYSVAFSPDGRCLASGSADHSVRLWDAQSGQLIRQCDGHQSTVQSVAFSPDGRYLASGSADHSVRLWDAQSGQLIRQCDGHQGTVQSVAFSPDGRYLASGAEDESVRLWDVQSGQLIRQCDGHQDWVRSVAFSPDGRYLASGSRDHSVRLWDVQSGAEHLRFDFPENERYAWRLCWAASGAFLVSTHVGDIVRLWDTRDLATLAVPVAAASDTPHPLSPELVALPTVLAALHRLGLYPPLAWLRDLHALLAGQADTETPPELSTHPGIRRLRDLRWPTPARVGLIALLLCYDPSQDWRPPPDLGPHAVRRQLADALAGEPMAPQAPPLPMALLTQAADAIDERLITLLMALGPEAVAAEPGLPLRLRHQASQLPKLAESQRRLLSVRLSPLEAGPAQGSGIGLDRSGIALKGPLTALVSSQLAYPQTLFAWRYQTNTLLYRTRTGREAPRLRPAVLVLDVSPPCYGPVEGITRLAAHALARTLRRAGEPVALLSAGGEPRAHALEHAADLLQVFTLRTLSAVEAAWTLSVAQRLRASLERNGVEPVIVLLTHAWWGAEALGAAPVSGLRGLFVQYPGQEVRPPWSDRCERWESIQADQFERLPNALGRLIG